MLKVNDINKNIFILHNRIYISYIIYKFSNIIKLYTMKSMSS